MWCTCFVKIAKSHDFITHGHRWRLDAAYLTVVLLWIVRHFAGRCVTTPKFCPQLSYFLQIGCVFWEDLKAGNAKG